MDKALLYRKREFSVESHAENALREFQFAPGGTEFLRSSQSLRSQDVLSQTVADSLCRKADDLILSVQISAPGGW